jgi:hypothetical protein
MYVTRYVYGRVEQGITTWASGARSQTNLNFSSLIKGEHHFSAALPPILSLNLATFSDIFVPYICAIFSKLCINASALVILLSSPLLFDIALQCLCTRSFQLLSLPKILCSHSEREREREKQAHCERMNTCILIHWFIFEAIQAQRIDCVHLS